MYQRAVPADETMPFNFFQPMDFTKMKDKLGCQSALELSKEPALKSSKQQMQEMIMQKQK